MAIELRCPYCSNKRLCVTGTYNEEDFFLVSFTCTRCLEKKKMSLKFYNEMDEDDSVGQLVVKWIDRYGNEIISERSDSHVTILKGRRVETSTVSE